MGIPGTLRCRVKAVDLGTEDEDGDRCPTLVGLNRRELVGHLGDLASCRFFLLKPPPPLSRPWWRRRGSTRPVGRRTSRACLVPLPTSSDGVPDVWSVNVSPLFVSEPHYPVPTSAQDEKDEVVASLGEGSYVTHSHPCFVSEGGDPRPGVQSTRVNTVVEL